MPTRLHKSGNGSMRVPSGAQYIGRLVQIQAQKGSGSNWPHEFFKHDFKESNEVYKILANKNPPGGSVKIYDKLEKAVLQNGSISFSRGKVYGKKNGNIILTGDKGRYLVVSLRPLWDRFKYPD